ncbi:PAS domain S-box protein, partial [Crocinitomicaceae bacterium]|nr:PAS domain S-box protein [Crocinitomicaceae bacterium]
MQIDKRFDEIQEFLIQLSKGNYDYKIPTTAARDNIDAVILGITMLGQELQVFQQKHTALFEHSSKAILIYDSHLNVFTDSNLMATSLLGFSKEDMRLLTIVDLFPKDEKKNAESKKAYLKSGGLINFDAQIETKYGILRDISFLSKKLPYDKEQFFQITLIDTTEAKKKERRLIELKDKIEFQKAFYELILNSIPSDIAVFDKNHRYLFVNPQGIQDEKVRKFMIGKDDFDYAKLKGISDEKAVARRKFFNEIVRTKNHETWSEEHIDKNGSRKVVQRDMGPVYDEKGKLLFVIGYGTDITKRVLAEEENKKLSFVAKNTDNGVLMLNKNKEITWANDAFLIRSGYSMDEIIGKNSNYSRFHKTSVSSYVKVCNAMHSQKKVSLEVLRKSKSGKDYWVDLNIQPLFDNTKNLMGFMFIEFDITARILNKQTMENLNLNLESLVKEKTKEIRVHELELERLLSKEKSRTITLRNSEKKLKKSLLKEKELGDLKTSFVSTASHQFRTPLAIIQSNSELLLRLIDRSENKDIEQYKKITARIKGEIAIMTTLMDDVLSLGKLATGNVSYVPEDTDLVEFCEKLSEEYNDIQLDGRSIIFSTKGEAYKVHLDHKLLTHALSNLISNAFKYSAEKESPQLNI